MIFLAAAINTKASPVHSFSNIRTTDPRHPMLPHFNVQVGERGVSFMATIANSASMQRFAKQVVEGLLDDKWWQNRVRHVWGVGGAGLVV